MTDGLLDEILALERRLLDPKVRPNPAEVQRLLAPGFLEIGASGALWDRESVVAALAAEPGPPTTVSQVTTRLVSEVAVLLVYRAQSAGRTSWRSSLWVRDDAGWRVVFHQGTPDAAGEGGPAVV